MELRPRSELTTGLVLYGENEPAQLQIENLWKIVDRRTGEELEIQIMKWEIGHGPFIQEREEKLKFLLSSFFISIIFIVFGGQSVCAYSEADMFLGPSPGENIKIKASDFGTITRRICTKINDDGSYVIEEWTKLPKPKKKSSAEERSKTKLPEGAYYWDDAPEETMYRYSLTAENGKLIFNKGKSNENIILNLNNREWSQYIWTTEGDVKADYAIVKEEEKVVLGKLRKLVHVKYSFDLKDLHYEELYVVASGLGIIYTESLAPGSNKLTSTLVEE